MIDRQTVCEESQLKTASYREFGLTGVEIRREKSEEVNRRLFF